MAYYSSAADPGSWDQHWQAYLSPENYRGAERGQLGGFEEPFIRYLPLHGRTLEAGCGLGQHVLALRVRGYDAEGVEWGAETVKAARTLHPDLPIRVGDVTQLRVPDGHYGGYISLGVVEHRHEGPEPFLQEAWRVLEPGGVALISVPFFHPLRRLKARLRLYRGKPDGLEFYQYAFAEAEFSALLRRAGFRVADRMPYDGAKGMRDEIPVLRLMLRWRNVGRLLNRLLQSWKWAGRHLGHMILFVCRREG